VTPSGALARPSTSRTLLSRKATHRVAVSSRRGAARLLPAAAMRGPAAVPPAAPRGEVGSYDASMTSQDEQFDALETPRCAVHPTVRLVDVGTDPEGRDARWACPVEGCTFTRLV
jgi:hypothetical protein